ncbi:hypothetical protein GW17_00051008 [Ensete ventricosum]|nr:hypothetical protein GW17_00051008 [Ensete ventricosum]
MACELSMYVEGVADLCFLPPHSYAPLQWEEEGKSKSWAFRSLHPWRPHLHVHLLGLPAIRRYLARMASLFNRACSCQTVSGYYYKPHCFLLLCVPEGAHLLPSYLQRLRTCQACIDQEGLSQQSLLIRPPKYHKHYILQGK